MSSSYPHILISSYSHISISSYPPWTWGAGLATMGNLSRTISSALNVNCPGVAEVPWTENENWNKFPNGGVCVWLTNSHFLMSIYQIIFVMPKSSWGAKICFTILSLNPQPVSHATCTCQSTIDRLGRGCRNRRSQNPGIAKKGEGLTPAKIFWWICRGIPKTLPVLSRVITQPK